MQCLAVWTFKCVAGCDEGKYTSICQSKGTDIRTTVDLHLQLPNPDLVRPRSAANTTERTKRLQAPCMLILGNSLQFALCNNTPSAPSKRHYGILAIQAQSHRLC